MGAKRSAITATVGVLALVSALGGLWLARPRVARAVRLHRAIGALRGASASGADVTELLEIDDPRATLALVEDVGALGDQSLAIDSLPFALELFASGAEPLDPRVHDALAAIASDTRASPHARLAALYGLEELASPAYPHEPIGAGTSEITVDLKRETAQEAFARLRPALAIPIDDAIAERLYFPPSESRPCRTTPWRLVVWLARNARLHVTLDGGRVGFVARAEVSARQPSHWSAEDGRVARFSYQEYNQGEWWKIAVPAPIEITCDDAPWFDVDPEKLIRAVAALHGCTARATGPKTFELDRRDVVRR